MHTLATVLFLLALAAAISGCVEPDDHPDTVEHSHAGGAAQDDPIGLATESTTTLPPVPLGAGVPDFEERAQDWPEAVPMGTVPDSIDGGWVTVYECPATGLEVEATIGGWRVTDPHSDGLVIAGPADLDDGVVPEDVLHSFCGDQPS